MWEWSKNAVMEVEKISSNLVSAFLKLVPLPHFSLEQPLFNIVKHSPLHLFVFWSIIAFVDVILPNLKIKKNNNNYYYY